MAKASLIPNVVERPEDVIGHVDAVIVATDIGHEHIVRCGPFVEAGIPVFVDKPLVDNQEDLRTGVMPFPFSETVELMKLIIAGIRSRHEGAREVTLDEIVC